MPMDPTTSLLDQPHQLHGCCLGAAWVLRARAALVLLGYCLGAAWVLLGCCLRTACVLLGCCLGAAWVLLRYYF
eukprot:10786821-Lingulodinium_polyedra.AAC.1